MKPKLTVVVSHPIQHFAPVYQEIARKGLIEISVLYLSESGSKEYYDRQFGRSLAWNVDLLSGYQHRFLRPGLTTVPKGFVEADIPEICSILDSEDPDAILIYGYTRLLNWRVRHWTRKNQKLLLYCSDSVLHRRRAPWRLLIKSMLLPFFFRAVDICLSAGDSNEKYFLRYGVPLVGIRRCPLPVDVTRLRKDLKGDQGPIRLQKRRELKIGDNDFVVLFCGKMYPKKRPGDLLQAITILNAEGFSVVGLFVGSGVLLDALRTSRNSRNTCIFTGFVNQDALPAYYCASDAIAIPSEEDAHPLVATEAAVFGLPLIVSDQVGCLGPNDVARTSQNAFSYPCGNVQALASHIRRLVQEPLTFKSMSEASRSIAETQDVCVTASCIEEAVLNSGKYQRKE